MTPEEFSIRMDLLADALPNAVDKAMRFAVEESQTIIQERVFNLNEKVDGSSLGAYKSESYKKWRESKGLQTSVRDFQVNGNLLRSIKANTSVGNYSLEFVGSQKNPRSKSGKETQNAVIGFGLEERLYGKRRTAFYLNENDINNITEQVNEIYTNEVKAILGTK